MRLAPVCFILEQPIESRGSVEAPDLLVHAVGLQQVAHSAMPSVDAFPAPTATPIFPAISKNATCGRHALTTALMASEKT